MNENKMLPMRANWDPSALFHLLYQIKYPQLFLSWPFPLSVWYVFQATGQAMVQYVSV